MIPAMLGVPFVPGWITPGIPVVLLFLGDFKPGPEAIQALFALQLLVFIIFLVLGVTRLGSAMVKLVPNSLKAGIIIGAGIAAIMGEISSGGRLAATPISLSIGSLVCLYLMFSVSFKGLIDRVPLAKKSLITVWFLACLSPFQWAFWSVNTQCLISNGELLNQTLSECGITYHSILVSPI